MYRDSLRSMGGSYPRQLLGFTLSLLLLLTLIPQRQVHADAPTPLLDQSFTDPAGSAVGINECCRYVAQTFTAGITGALTAVSLDVLAISDRQLKVAIHGVTNGLPNDTVLSDVYVWDRVGGTALSYAPLSLMIDVGTVYVQAGHQYAIVVNYEGAGAPGAADGTWVGAAGDYYTGGAAFATNDETFNTWTSLGNPPLDLHFKSYVVPDVPVSDLSVSFVSGDKKAKACGLFEEVFKIRNNGPDTADRVVLGIGLTDQFDVVSVQEASGTLVAPYTLAPGQSLTIKAIIKVTAFVPMESRQGLFSAHVFTDVWPDIEIDPNETNDYYFGAVRLIGKTILSCP